MALEVFASCQRELSSDRQIPLLGWYGLPLSGEVATVAHYAEMRAAGLTINFSHEIPLSAEAVFAALDTAHAAGVAQMLRYEALDLLSEADLKRLIAHPALAGYYIRDEPSSHEFAALAATVRRVQAIDTLHPCYINLFPNYASNEQIGEEEGGRGAYRRHVRRYIEEVPVPFVSFDHYPVTVDSARNRHLRGEFYRNLEIIADESRKAGKPFWAFALATAHMDYPTPTLSDLRLQAFSDLAYGAQGIQYFTWFDPWGDAANDSVPVRIDGTLSPVYATVQAMSREIAALSPVFLDSRVVWTAHSGRVPRGSKTFEPQMLPPEITSLEISEPGALISYLEKGSNRFLVIVNHDVNETITVNVKTQPQTRMVNKAGKIVKVVKEQRLEAGDMIVLALEKVKNS